MNFNDDYKKLQSIAEGRYNSIKYELTTTADGEMKQECQLYVDPSIYAYAETWDLAFLELDKILHPENNIPAPIEVDDISEIDEKYYKSNIELDKILHPENHKS